MTEQRRFLWRRIFSATGFFVGLSIIVCFTTAFYNPSTSVLGGISAVFAAAASAGFSLTDRGGASRLILESGHHATDRADKGPHQATTLARYMPGADYPHTQRQLLDAGWPPATPIVLVSCAGQSGQQICRTTLAALAESAPLPPPTILLIGQSAAHAAAPANAT